MSNLAEAAQAVIERWDCPLWDWEMEGPTADLIHALRLALAAHEAAKPEPTAFMGVNPRTGTLEFCAHQPSPSVMRDFDMKPLYAAPVAAASPLSDEQLLEILGDIDADTKRLPPGVKAFARAVEQAHGIKETT